MATELRDRIRNLLNSVNLELSMEKTLITNARENRAKFLGTYIKRIDSNNGPPKFARHGVSNIKRRNPTGNLWMTAPVLDLVKKLINREMLEVKSNR